MNNDLISREALKKSLQNAYREFGGYDLHNFMIFAERVDAIIDNEPEVEGRPHGKWISITKNTAFTQKWICSNCSRIVEKATLLDPDVFFPFCHCGADMRQMEAIKNE